MYDMFDDNYYTNSETMIIFKDKTDQSHNPPWLVEHLFMK